MHARPFRLCKTRGQKGLKISRPRGRVMRCWNDTTRASHSNCQSPHIQQWWKSLVAPLKRLTEVWKQHENVKDFSAADANSSKSKPQYIFYFFILRLLCIVFVLHCRRSSSGGKGTSWGRACLIKLPSHRSALRAPLTLERLWNRSSNWDCIEKLMHSSRVGSVCVRACVCGQGQRTNSSATSQCKCCWFESG